MRSERKQKRAVRRLLRTMRAQVRRSMADPRSHVILRSILAQDPAPLPVSIFKSLKNRVRYHREDPHVVASVPILYGDPCKGGGVGDCNDFAVAVAALGLMGRYQARWAIGLDAAGEPVHIWTQLRQPGGEWIDVDPTPGAPEPGHGSPVDIPGAQVVGWTAVHVRR